VYSVVKSTIKDHVDEVKHFIMAHAEKNYHFKNLDSGLQKEEVEDLGKKFNVVRQMKGNYPNVGVIFDVDEIKEELEKSLAKLISEMDDKRLNCYR